MGVMQMVNISTIHNVQLGMSIYVSGTPNGWGILDAVNYGCSVPRQHTFLEDGDDATGTLDDN